MPDSEEESDFHTDSDEESQNRVKKAVNSFISKKPVMNKTSKSKADSFTELKSKLNKFTSTKPRQSTRLDTKKDAENVLREMKAEIEAVSKKFDTVIGCVLELFDKIESQDETIARLDARLTILESRPLSYANVVSSQQPEHAPQTGDRLDRLEYLSSEENRKKRILEVTITHPDINKDTSDLKAHVREFLSNQLDLENREFDENMKVFKARRVNSLKIAFSDIRFKKFMYSARKKKLTENPSSLSNLYISENLTSYNFRLLRSLKEEKKRRNDNNETNFDSVYSFEGRIFVKKVRSSDKNSSIPISSKKSMQDFLNQLDEANGLEDVRDNN